jgi:hypothetical protein
LSDFNYDTHQFEEFVDNLEYYQGNKNDLQPSWSFENPLLYLNLPSLRATCAIEVVSRLLEFLSANGISTIMNVRLPDSAGRYSDEFVRDHLLEKFSIHNFDWMRLDVRPQFFASLSAKSSTSRLERLYLYSHNHSTTDIVTGHKEWSRKVRAFANPGHTLTFFLDRDHIPWPRR